MARLDFDQMFPDTNLRGTPTFSDIRQVLSHMNEAGYFEGGGTPPNLEDYLKRDGTVQLVATYVPSDEQDIATKKYVDENAIRPTGLELLTEGGSNGWRLIGRNPDYYGDIGNEAIDLSTSTTSGDYGATGERAVAFGFMTVASGRNSFAGGDNTVAKATNAFAFGSGVSSNNDCSVAFGSGTVASGGDAFVFGQDSEANGDKSFAGGLGSIAEGNASIAFGLGASAEGIYSTAIGKQLKASGESSYAQGSYTTASGLASHAEGYYTTAEGSFSHAEGYATHATGNYGIHAEGYETINEGTYGSHVEGCGAKVTGSLGAHAEGYGTIAQNDSMHVEGRYNVGTATDTIHETGIGIRASDRKNAFEIYTDGRLVAPELTATLIDAAGDKSLIIKEYLLSAEFGNSLPTADPGEAGRLWNDGGALKISAG